MQYFETSFVQSAVASEPAATHDAGGASASATSEPGSAMVRSRIRCDPRRGRCVGFGNVRALQRDGSISDRVLRVIRSVGRAFGFASDRTVGLTHDAVEQTPFLLRLRAREARPLLEERHLELAEHRAEVRVLRGFGVRPRMAHRAEPRHELRAFAVEHGAWRDFAVGQEDVEASKALRADVHRDRAAIR
jgi:hypothetical protein